MFVVPSYSLLLLFLLKRVPGGLAGGALVESRLRTNALPTRGWRSRWLRLERVKPARLGWAAAALKTNEIDD